MNDLETCGSAETQAFKLSKLSLEYKSTTFTDDPVIGSKSMQMHKLRWYRESFALDGAFFILRRLYEKSSRN
jgi:hypothetical protein